MENSQQDYQVTIHDLAFGGEGVGRLEDNRIVFVPFSAVGDELKIQITQKKKSFLRGEIVEIIKPSKDRENPPCPCYQQCGGCQYQHISYQAELVAKEKQLRDTLVRVGKISNPNILPMLSYPQPYHYRNRITVHNERGKIGFRALNNRDLIDIKECLIATDEVNQKLQKLREQPRSRPHYSVRADSVAGEAFYQTNALLSDALQNLICDSLDSKTQAVLEGYAGVGFFTEPLSGKVEKIIAIESSEKAINSQPKHKNIQWIHSTCEEHLLSAAQEFKNLSSACLVDPPREGLSKAVVQHLLDLPSSFNQILYLSCNPSTLSRDLHLLSQKWTPQSFQPIDLFPRTAHLECLTILKPNRALASH